MFKFLRKYNKWILAVGGTLLMIVFLVPQAVENMAQRAGVARATRATVGVDGAERVPVAEWDQIILEHEFIDRFSRESGMSFLPGIGRPTEAGHWYLLVREAKAAGLIGSPNSVEITDEQLALISANTGTPPRIVRSAVARLDGVTRLLAMYTNAGEVSDRRLQQYAARMFHRVETRIIPIEASADAATYDPTEEELQKQLDEYGELEPGEGAMGFGYRLPDRVKLEWIEVSAEAVKQALLASEEMNNIALRRHWLRESRREGSTFPPVEEGAPIPAMVRENLLQQLTNEKLEEIARFGNDQLRAGRRALRTADGYAVLPEDWEAQRIDLRSLAEQIQARYDIDLPAYRAIGDRWLEIGELAELEGIGRATTDRFGTPRGLTELVRAAKEFGGSPIIQMQAGVAGPPLRGDRGNVYIFRIVEADAARSPTSVDEVRDTLVNDIRRKAHYQVLLETVSDVEREVIEQGMLATAMSRGTGVSPVTATLANRDSIRFQQQFGQPTQATPTALPVVGPHEEATAAIIDRALELPQDVDFSELPIEQRVFTVPVEDSLTVLVVELVRNLPLTRSSYAELAADNTLKALIVSDELGGGDHIREVFGYESLTARHNFELHQVAGAEEEAQPTEAEVGG